MIFLESILSPLFRDIFGKHLKPPIPGYFWKAFYAPCSGTTYCVSGVLCISWAWQMFVICVVTVDSCLSALCVEHYACYIYVFIRLHFNKWVRYLCTIQCRIFCSIYIFIFFRVYAHPSCKREDPHCFEILGILNIALLLNEFCFSVMYGQLYALISCIDILVMLLGYHSCVCTMNMCGRFYSHNYLFLK